MSKEKRRVPKLRFPGFTEDWEQRKADYIFKSVTDKGYPELPVLSASQELGMVYRDQNGIDIQHDKKNEASYKRVLPGQFVIHLRSFQGGFAYSEIEGITSPAYTVINFKNSNEQYGLFWKHVFKSETFIKRLETITYGIRDGRSISFSDFKSLILWYPSFSEQKLIGDSLAVVEKGITLHQRKLEHLNLKKKALLQKLFPKNGERYPELRFPGFTDAWEQRKLNDFVTIRRGLTYKPSDIAENGIRVLRSSNIDEDQFIKSNDDVFVNIDAVNIPFAKNGDILITSANGSSRLVGKHTIINDIAENSAVHGGFMLLAESNNPLFTDALLSSNWYKRFINTYVAGGNGAIGNLSKSDLESQSVMVPSEHEQIKIGQWYGSINQLITLHQRKLEHLQLQKKALLQQMFV